MQKILSLIIICLISPLALTGLRAQDSILTNTPSNRHTTHSVLFGAGLSNLYDTYLSPVTYKGPHLSFLRETLRPTHWLDGKISVQTMFDGYLAYAENRANTGNEIGGMLNYAIGWHYNWKWLNGLRIMAGGDIHAGLGALYNLRNSNNPVQARAQLYMAASAMAIYPFRIRKQPFTARYQITLPLLGGMFSPQYGQSYYEMSLGNYDHNVCLTYPGNSPSMRHFLTIDFPIKGLTFRAGYLCDIWQSKVNGIKTHTWNHSFMIGYVKHFTFIKRKEQAHRTFIL